MIISNTHKGNLCVGLQGSDGRLKLHALHVALLQQRDGLRGDTLRLNITILRRRGLYNMQCMELGVAKAITHTS